MPAKYCLCPDGQKRTIEECLNRCPRPEGRCLTLPTLHSVFWQREWTGTPSTTMLLNGTRLEYLKLTCDYAIDPRDRAFALLGTRHHGKLEAVSKKLNVLSEEKLEGEVKGTLDLIEPDELAEGEQFILTDYKTFGSFRVARALGLEESKVPDPTGAIYKSSGKWGKAGDVKMVSLWTPNPEKADLFNEELQLNSYRLGIEALGFPVSRMRLQVTVRDGGTYIASNRGVDQNIYIIPVKRLADDDVRAYFKRKGDALIAALENGKMPKPCNARETWDGRRCAGYCEVAEFCPQGGKQESVKEVADGNQGNI